MRDRLIEMLAELGLGQNSFEKKVGWPIGTISRMKYGVRSDQLTGLIREYPTLNIKWLITGEGEMWDIPAPKADETPKTNTISTEWLMARIEAQERLIEALSKRGSDISQSITI